MISTNKQNEVLLQLENLSPKQVDSVLNYIADLLESRKRKNKRLKRKALIQIRKAIRKGL